MHKAILMMLLAIVSSRATASWLVVDSGESITTYADPATIRRAGNRVKIWMLFDYKNAGDLNGKPYMSIRMQGEYDCKEDQFRVLDFTYHSGNMAEGDVVDTAPSPTTKWDSVPLPPGEVQTFWKTACGKPAVASNRAVARWVEVGRNDTLTNYADPATIRRTGHMVRMWELLDLKTAHVVDESKPYMSARVQREFDCKEGRTRMLAISAHSGNMAEGEVVYAHSNPAKWGSVAPGTAGETMWKFACRKIKLK